MHRPQEIRRSQAVLFWSWDEPGLRGGRARIAMAQDRPRNRS